MNLSNEPREIEIETEHGPVKAIFDPRKYLKISIGYKHVFAPAEKSAAIIEALAGVIGETEWHIGNAACHEVSDSGVSFSFVNGIYLIDTEERRAYYDKVDTAAKARKAFEALPVIAKKDEDPDNIPF